MRGEFLSILDFVHLRSRIDRWICGSNPIHTSTHTHSHGRGGDEQVLAIDRRPLSPSSLPDPQLLALIQKGGSTTHTRRGNNLHDDEDEEEGEGLLNPADPAVAMAQELAATLAGQVWADLRGVCRKGGGGAMRSRGGSGKRLMELDRGEGKEAGDEKAGEGTAGVAVEGAVQEGDAQVVVGKQKKYPRK